MAHQTLRSQLPAYLRLSCEDRDPLTFFRPF